MVMPDGYAEIVFCFGSVSRDGSPMPSPFDDDGLLNQPVVFSGVRFPAVMSSCSRS